MRERKESQRSSANCLHVSCVSTLLLHSYSIYPSFPAEMSSEQWNEVLFLTNSRSHSPQRALAFGMIDQCSVLRQIDVLLVGGAHMMLSSRQTHRSNVIRECSCVSALPILTDFKRAVKQPCHFDHCRQSSKAWAPFSLLLMSTALFQCQQDSSVAPNPSLLLLQLSSSSIYVIHEESSPTPLLTTHANGPHYVASWDTVWLKRAAGQKIQAGQ